jgi:hypothetical protein
VKQVASNFEARCRGNGVGGRRVQREEIARLQADAGASQKRPVREELQS